MASVKKTARKASHGILDTVAKHPVGTAAVVAGTVAGVVLARKAVNTAAKVVTIKAVGGAAKDVAGAVQGSRGSRSRKPAAGRKPAARGAKARSAKRK